MKTIPKADLDARAEESVRLALDYVGDMRRETAKRRQRENPRFLRAGAVRLLRSALALLEDM